MTIPEDIRSLCAKAASRKRSNGQVVERSSGQTSAADGEIPESGGDCARMEAGHWAGQEDREAYLGAGLSQNRDDGLGAGLNQGLGRVLAEVLVQEPGRVR